MIQLADQYISELEAIAQEVQASETLSAYLEEEEEEHYLQLKELFEPRISALYERVAENDPLQILDFEKRLLNDSLEGLFLPRILGYSVLRGEVDERIKYYHPQNHFKDVLLAICNSANFDILRKRIGQSIQMGFAMSSDIWITSLINEIDNKKVRYFLQGQKLDKYRQIEERIRGYNRYAKQFTHDNFHTITFPDNLSQLKVSFIALKRFLLLRARNYQDNSSIIPFLLDFAKNDAFFGTDEYLQIVMITAFFFQMEEKEQDQITEALNQVRATVPDYEEKGMQLLLELHKNKKVKIDAAADQRFSLTIDKSKKDGWTELFNLKDIIHGIGYTNEKAQEATSIFYTQHEGLSTINECVRQTIFQYFETFINNLEDTDYPEWFEITKLFPVYMNIFANQQFNQDLKDVSMVYVKKLMRKYTDKRGRDYQDVKKFVATTFVDFGFLTEKEVIELFKTRRKRKKTA